MAEYGFANPPDGILIIKDNSGLSEVLVGDPGYFINRIVQIIIGQVIQYHVNSRLIIPREKAV